MGYIQHRGGGADFQQTLKRTIEENTRGEDKTHEETNIEVHRTTLLKNSVISVENHLALTTYNYAQPGLRFDQNSQNGVTLQKFTAQIR